MTHHTWHPKASTWQTFLENPYLNTVQLQQQRTPPRQQYNITAACDWAFTPLGHQKMKWTSPFWPCQLRPSCAHVPLTLTPTHMRLHGMYALHTPSPSSH